MEGCWFRVNFLIYKFCGIIYFKDKKKLNVLNFVIYELFGVDVFLIFRKVNYIV